MPTLSNPTLQINLVSGTSQVKITAGVKVAFDSVEENFIKLLGLKFKLRCRLWGEDGGFNGGPDPIVWLPSKIVTADGTQTFTKTMDRSLLDEDWEGNDEIYARFTCQSTTPSFPLPAAPVNSATITGNF